MLLSICLLCFIRLENTAPPHDVGQHGAVQLSINHSSRLESARTPFVDPPDSSSSHPWEMVTQGKLHCMRSNKLMNQIIIEILTKKVN